MRLLLLGAGYSALCIAQRLQEKGMQGPCISIHGTTRHTDRFEPLIRQGVQPILFDGIDSTPELDAAVQDATHIVVSIAPAKESPGHDPALECVSTVLENSGINNCALKWVGYLSTVGVYGDHAGQWVDENTRCKPVSARSVSRLAAEQAWQSTLAARAIPLCVFRLSGIYGPERNALLNLQAGTARRLVKPGQVFNRIHVHDIGTAVTSAATNAVGGVFNITDDCPAPPQDVVTYAAELLGITPPESIDFDTAELSPMARSFYGENKRVSNAASKQLPGMVYRYPDYKAGLRSLHEL